MSVYSVIPLIRPRRTAHNLSHSVDTTLNIGQLVPTCRPIECVPGDTMDLSSITSVDLMPLIKPFKGDLFLESWAFFCSNDMLYKEADSGKFTDILVSASDPTAALSLPTLSLSSEATALTVGYLPDYFGMPLEVGNDVSNLSITPYPFRAYYKIWDEYFRDENLQTAIFENETNGLEDNLSILNVNYKKDRFTSAFTSEQKGNPITLSLTGYAPVVVKTTSGTVSTSLLNSSTSVVSATDTGIGITEVSTLESTRAPLYADMTSISALSINDLRLANKLQKWEERLQLAGSRPKEYLLANYGICPNDETLQRPVLIGHIKTPVIVDSVIQNVPTDDEVGATKYGNGVSVGSTHFGKWLCKEFGWIIVLSALRPKSNYTQGIHRSLIKTNIYDFFNPMFESLGQQEILNCEIYAQNTSDDSEVWGFTDRYNEYRHLESMTTGALRSENGLQPWVMNRKFSELPTLSEDFIKVQASEYDYLFNFTSSATIPQAVIHSVNIIKGIRPISKYAHPSL